METVKEDCKEETPRQWLKLSLGEDVGSPVKDSDLSTPAMFPCQFCTRKFYSCYALGGHQNAHKTERYEARRKKMTKLMDIAVMDMAVTRVLGIQSRSFIQKPSREGIPVSARFSESSKDWGMEVPYTLAEWPGGFNFERKPLEELSDAEKLDLDLKL